MANTPNLLQVNENYLKRVGETFHMELNKVNGRMLACGTIVSPITEVTIDSKPYYKFMLECPRLQNTCDTIPVVLEKKMDYSSFKLVSQGDQLTCIGCLRSMNWHDETGKRHLDIFMDTIDFALGTEHIESGFDKNIVIVSGHICTIPTLKYSKTNRSISEFRITVSNHINTASNYFPIVVWGMKAEEVYSQYNLGDRLTIIGRLQSRVYYKKRSEEEVETRVAYEISSRYMIRHTTTPSSTIPNIQSTLPKEC